MKNKLKELWQGWQKVAKKIGDFQARLILSLFFFLIVFPIGLIARMFSDPLSLKKTAAREPYRPFAPWVLEDYASELFDLPEPERHFPNRFMPDVVDVKDDAKAKLPAIAHVDGSARLQTVRQETAPLYYRLIDKFGQATGVPVVLNTSFNLRGEPIVTSPARRAQDFYNSGRDFLVLGNCIVAKQP